MSSAIFNIFEYISSTFSAPYTLASEIFISFSNLDEIIVFSSVLLVICEIVGALIANPAGVTLTINRSVNIPAISFFIILPLYVIC